MGLKLNATEQTSVLFSTLLPLQLTFFLLLLVLVAMETFLLLGCVSEKLSVCGAVDCASMLKEHVEWVKERSAELYKITLVITTHSWFEVSYKSSLILLENQLACSTSKNVCVN